MCYQQHIQVINNTLASSTIHSCHQNTPISPTHICVINNIIHDINNTLVLSTTHSGHQCKKNHIVIIINTTTNTSIIITHSAIHYSTGILLQGFIFVKACTYWRKHGFRNYVVNKDFHAEILYCRLQPDSN